MTQSSQYIKKDIEKSTFLKQQMMLKMVSLQK